MDLLLGTGTALGLAYMAGINAYLSLLAIGIVIRFQLLPYLRLNPGYAFMTTDIFLIIFLVLTVLNFAADKIPGEGEIWNLLQTVMRPLAGALVVGAIGEAGIFHWLFVIAGLLITLMSHLVKLGIRTALSALTVGCADPVLGVLEDGLVIGGIIVCLVAPPLILAYLIVFTILFFWYAPSLFSAIWYQWRITASFCSWLFGRWTGYERTETSLDVFARLDVRARAQLLQWLPGRQFHAGVPALWHRLRGGRGVWSKRRVVQSVWLIATGTSLILLPASQPEAIQVVPFLEIQTFDQKSGWFKGSISIHKHSGARYELTILRPMQKSAEQMVLLLRQRYSLPPAGKPAKQRPASSFLPG